MYFNRNLLRTVLTILCILKEILSGCVSPKSVLCFSPCVLKIFRNQNSYETSELVNLIIKANPGTLLQLPSQLEYIPQSKWIKTMTEHIYDFRFHETCVTNIQIELITREMKSLTFHPLVMKDILRVNPKFSFLVIFGIFNGTQITEVRIPHFLKDLNFHAVTTFFFKMHFFVERNHHWMEAYHKLHRITAFELYFFCVLCKYQFLLLQGRGPLRRFSVLSFRKRWSAPVQILLLLEARFRDLKDMMITAAAQRTEIESFEIVLCQKYNISLWYRSLDYVVSYRTNSYLYFTSFGRADYRKAYGSGNQKFDWSFDGCNLYYCDDFPNIALEKGLVWISPFELMFAISLFVSICLLAFFTAIEGICMKQCGQNYLFRLVQILQAFAASFLRQAQPDLNQRAKRSVLLVWMVATVVSGMYETFLSMNLIAPLYLTPRMELSLLFQDHVSLYADTQDPKARKYLIDDICSSNTTSSSRNINCTLWMEMKLMNSFKFNFEHLPLAALRFRTARQAKVDMMVLTRYIRRDEAKRNASSNARGQCYFKLNVALSKLMGRTFQGPMSYYFIETGRQLLETGILNKFDEWADRWQLIGLGERISIEETKNSPEAPDDLVYLRHLMSMFAIVGTLYAVGIIWFLVVELKILKLCLDFLLRLAVFLKKFKICFKFD